MCLKYLWATNGKRLFIMSLNCLVHPSSKKLCYNGLIALVNLGWIQWNYKKLHIKFSLMLSSRNQCKSDFSLQLTVCCRIIVDQVWLCHDKLNEFSVAGVFFQVPSTMDCSTSFLRTFLKYFGQWKSFQHKECSLCFLTCLLLMLYKWNRTERLV